MSDLLWGALKESTSSVYLEVSFHLFLNLANLGQNKEVSKFNIFAQLAQVVVCFCCFCCLRQGHRVSQGPPEQMPISVGGQGLTNPGPSGCNHAVVCVNILHSQL